MDTSPLKEAGLTNGEVRVYLALLETGSTTIGPILKKSGITKSIIYRILEKLIKKGLVSYVIKDKTKYFQAAQPNKILEYVDFKEKELQINRNKIREMIPQLMIKQEFVKKSEANIYEGFKGLMTAYENRYQKLKRNDEVVLYGLPPEQPGFYHAYWKKNHMRLSKEGIKCRMLYHPDVTDVNLKDRNNYKGCEARRMPFKAENPSWIMIYKDVTLIAIPQGELPFAFEITSQQIAESFKNYFEWLWKQSKEFKP
ncbi:MAG: helix-turn-helix domain-containing protein [Nanoarchaeota archaeon]|nr:helix-turn-helix domain-containing protein [Nanoarchaeota archaeon]MBU1854761.1 helix-turn-helix domain-containing protein [Nanoarchaeota archaeon]